MIPVSMYPFIRPLSTDTELAEKLREGWLLPIPWTGCAHIDEAGNDTPIMAIAPITTPYFAFCTDCAETVFAVWLHIGFCTRCRASLLPTEQGIPSYTHGVGYDLPVGVGKNPASPPIQVMHILCDDCITHISRKDD